MNKTSLLALGGFAILGCTDAPKPDAGPVAVVELSLPAAPTKPTETPIVSQGPTSQPKPVEPVVKMPEDLGGKAVQKSLMPTLTMPAEVPGPKAPRPRLTELDKGELPAPPVAWQKPAIALLLKVKPAKPSIPPEHAPADLGQAAAENLSGVKFVEKPLARADAPASPGAPEVQPLARQIVERTPVDDPTAEISAGKLIETPFPYPVGSLPFLKMTIPDPFEFVGQLKGKLPRDTEFGTVPSVVPPEKK